MYKIMKENTALAVVTTPVWVNLIKQGAYTIEQVPNLSNLREVVASVLEGGE